VLVGAGTARTEGYRALRAKPEYAELRASLGQAPAPTLVIVSHRLDLDRAGKLFVGGANRTIVITAHNSDRQAREELSATADIVIAGDFGVDIGKAVDAMVERGLTRILCEGGPHLLSDVVAAGRLDELCLTLSPQLVGGPGPHILAGTEQTLRDFGIQSLLEHDGAVLVRYVTR
jgi:riboflavin biosynthesis pyrimidine reductase